jgi:hypothetical protein
MLVYGDRSEAVAPRKGLRALTATLKAAEETQPGPGRHDLLVSAFLQAAGLAQGLADAEFEAKGYDDLSASQEAAMTLLLALARKVASSAWTNFANSGPPIALELMGLALQPAPDAIRVKEAEGYAFYGVYPEAYLRAAVQHSWSAPPLVIGLRSIGLGLAALVGAAAAAKTVISLRPVGHPFQRELKLSEALKQLLAAHEGPFAIVDEGPGLSGSSFGATADLLEGLGVARDRIVFLPSHDGPPGDQASKAHRDRWVQAQRSVVTFQELSTEEPLETWFADLTGEIEHVEDLSGGAWREASGLAPGAWPPAFAGQERLKFRLHAASGRWLAKFAGLGVTGEAKLDRARALHRAGFSPEPLALRRGFLIERWETGLAGPRVDRPTLVSHLGSYLGFRASAFPADPAAGGDTAQLAEMVRVNAGELLSGGAADELAARFQELADVAPARMVHVDGRLHAWEWLVSPDGLLLKTDALDHSQAHDLVGAQDIAWDVAGAALEFDLLPEEVEVVCKGIEAVSGQRVDEQRLAACEIAYPAFQAGYWRFAEQASSGLERDRIRAHATRYVDALAALAGEDA